MTSIPQTGANLWSALDTSFLNDSRISDAFMPNYGDMTFLVPSSATPQLLTWVNAKTPGRDGTSFSYIYKTGYPPFGLGYVDHGTSANCRLQANSVAALYSGTAKPWTVVISARCTLAAPVGNGWLFSFTSSTTVTPIFGIVAVAGGTSFIVQRREDSGSTFNSTAFDPGLNNQFVFEASYNGSTLATKLNGTVIDSTKALGTGAMTVDRFTLGGVSNSGGTSLFMQQDLGGFAIGPTAFNSSFIARQLMKQIGLAT